MKSVLISIQPKWCELIASGKKTVEVRKTRPKLETPFKVYIYETQGRTETPFVDEEGHYIFKGRGQVIGEFVCDRIVQFENSLFDEVLPETVARSCVPMYDLLVYLGKQDFGYGWHISNLVIYDKPRELSEFKKPCNHKNDCCTCDRYDYIGHRCYDEITRPPQSWCYVESEGEG
jgi:predicted transcriptional regulator